MDSFFIMEDLEIWKNIVGYENYQISNLLNVRNSNGLILKISLNSNYYRFGLSKNNKLKYIRLHRLVAIAFIPNPENLPCINHIDGNKLNNNIDNLEWCTYRHNQLHAYRTGLRIPIENKGIKNHQAKLTNEDVIFIRNSDLKIKELCEIYGLKHQAISKIILRQRWTHI
jgi:hypothetical protein